MKIAIVGAGNMGSGIAQKYATEGHEVILYDNSKAGLARGRSLIETTLHEALARGIYKQDQIDQIFARLSFSTELSDLKDSEIVIEAVFEDREIKKNLFRELDVICDPETILATNTSSFRVEELANATLRPDRVIGLHYFYHPAKNRLVEIIRASQTSDATYNKSLALQEAIGKIPINSADSPGFVVNRFFVPWLNEAMRLVDEEVANVATVEWAAKKVFDIGMGPFELMNVTGVPITLHAATTLFDELGEFYRPCPLIEPVVQSQSKWDLAGDIDENAYDKIQQRLLDAVFFVAKQLVLEEVCTIEECDLGARVGLRWKRGPFEMMAALGEKSLAPKKLFTTRAGDVGVITLNRPDALNAIDGQSLKELEEAVKLFADDDSIVGIIINGKGRSFAAGADTQFFVENMRAKQVQKIVDFATFGQNVFRSLENCEKPIIALVHGMTLGGGLELALACDYILAVEGVQLGFPETGIGIYPGLGGTQRTARRIGIALTRWLVLSGEILSAERALEIGLIDKVCTSDEAFDEALIFARTKEAQQGERSPKQAKNFEELELFFHQRLSEIMRTKPSTVEGDIHRALKKISHKAPLALQMADELILASETSSLNEGLIRETLGLATIFATHDALVGISSIGKERPVFSGK